MTDTARAPIPMFEQRRIEAMILKHVYDALKQSHGIEVAQKTIAAAVRASSIEQAKEFAAKVGGKTSIQTFVDRQSLWKLVGLRARVISPVPPIKALARSLRRPLPPKY